MSSFFDHLLSFFRSGPVSRRDSSRRTRTPLTLEGLEERSLLSASTTCPVIHLTAPLASNHFFVRLKPGNTHTIQIRDGAGSSFQDVPLSTSASTPGAAVGAFVVAGGNGQSPQAVFVLVGDLNGDGISDLALHFGATLEVAPGLGDGSFTQAFQLIHAAPAAPTLLPVGDINGDGIPDLLALSSARNSGPRYSLLLGQADGSFVPVANIPVEPFQVHNTLVQLGVEDTTQGTVVPPEEGAAWLAGNLPVVPSDLAPPPPEVTPAPPPPSVPAPAPAANAEPPRRAPSPPLVPSQAALEDHADGHDHKHPSSSSTAGDGSNGHADGQGPPSGNSAPTRQVDAVHVDNLGAEAPAAPLVSAGPELETHAVELVPALSPGALASGAMPLGEVPPRLQAAWQPISGEEDETYPPLLQATFPGPLSQESPLATDGLFGALAEQPAPLLVTTTDLTEKTHPLERATGRGLNAGSRLSLSDLGQMVAQAFYLGSLKQHGTSGAPAAPSELLSTPDDTQLLVADLVQRSTETFTRVVQGFYLLFLGRAAVAGEESGWVSMLLAGQPYEQVLSTFLSTSAVAERANSLFAGGTPDERFVQSLYHLLLHRPAGESEMSAWLGALPTLGRGGVASFLLRSAEYRQIQVDAYYRELRQRPATPAEAVSWAGSPFDLLTIRNLLSMELPPAVPANGTST